LQLRELEKAARQLCCGYEKNGFEGALKLNKEGEGRLDGVAVHFFRVGGVGVRGRLEGDGRTLGLGSASFSHTHIKTERKGNF